MDVSSPNAVPVGILWWNGPTRRLTIIAKMTLMPKGGALVLADEQEPLRIAVPSTLGVAEEFHHPSDFVPFKPRCDVLFVGSAHSPTAQPVIPFQFRVGALERYVYALAAQPVTDIPLSMTYLRRESTYDTEEVSVGPLSDQHPHRACDADPRVPARASAFERTVLPAVFDGRCFNAAPLEQRIDPITPGTALVIPWRGIGPQNMWIPPMRPRVFLFDPSNESGLREVAMTCDTIWIDADRERCVLTFRGLIDPDHGGSFPTALVAVFASIYDAVVAGAANMICAQATIRKATEAQSLEESIVEAVPPQPTATVRTASSRDEEATGSYTIVNPGAPALPFVSTLQQQGRDDLPMPSDSGARPPVLPFVGATSAPKATSSNTPRPTQPLASPLPFVQPDHAPDSVLARASASTSTKPRTLPGATAAASALPFVHAARPVDAAPESGFPVASSSSPHDAALRSALPFVSSDSRKPPSTLPPSASFVSNEHRRPTAPPAQALPFVSDDFSPAALTRFDAQPLEVCPFPVPSSAASSALKPSSALDTSTLMRISLDTFAEIKVDLWSGVELREALAKHGIDQRSFHLYERRQTDELGDDVRQGALDRTRALRAALRRARERRGPDSTDDGIL